ncbi:hypothetical protein [Hydrogenibacillus schlegelii]|uniref:hypothetical protein n=1 Tax=Hydrogenibacillus schlegelii TaxID=1484 RepID=UPI0034A03FB6
MDVFGERARSPAGAQAVVESPATSKKSGRLIQASTNALQANTIGQASGAPVPEEAP